MLEIRHSDAAQRDGVTRHVVNVIVGYMVFTALPHHQSDRMPINAPAMVDMIVQNLVLLIHVPGAGPVSDQHDPALAHLPDLVALNPVLLRMEVQPDGVAAAVAE